MATAITVKKIIRTSNGLLESLTVAASTMEFANTGAQYFYVYNTGGTLIITITTPNTVDGNIISDLVVTVANAERRLIGPFPVGTYNDSSGLVQLAFDTVVGVSVDVYQLG